MDICSGVGLWDHTISLFLVFWGTSVLFTIVVTFPLGVERKECSTFYSIYYFSVSSSSVQSLSHVQLLATPRAAASQASLSITNSRSLLKLISIELMMLSDHLILCHPFLLSTLYSIQASGSFPMSQLFASGGQCFGVSASVLPMKIQGWFPLGLTDLISFLSKGLSRVFSVPQFRSINSSVLSFLYGLTLTSIHDYWKNHSFDWTDLCCQSNVSAFYYAI